MYKDAHRRGQNGNPGRATASLKGQRHAIVRCRFVRNDTADGFPRPTNVDRVPTLLIEHRVTAGNVERLFEDRYDEVWLQPRSARFPRRLTAAWHGLLGPTVADYLTWQVGVNGGDSILEAQVLY